RIAKHSAKYNIRNWAACKGLAAAPCEARPARGAQSMAHSLRRHVRGLVRFGEDRSGNILIVTAIILPVLIGAIGLGTDLGLWFYKHQIMQSAADSAAMSAGAAYRDGTNLTTEADAVTATYGFVAGTNGVVVTVNLPPKSGNYISTAGAV